MFINIDKVSEAHKKMVLKKVDVLPMAGFLTVIANVGVLRSGTTFPMTIHPFSSSITGLLHNQNASVKFLAVATIHSFELKLIF